MLGVSKTKILHGRDFAQPDVVFQGHTILGEWTPCKNEGNSLHTQVELRFHYSSVASLARDVEELWFLMNLSYL